MIDLKEILINSNYKKETEELINIANLAYKHWETYWTGFNSTYVCEEIINCLLYTSPSPRDMRRSRMPSSAWKKKK